MRLSIIPLLASISLFCCAPVQGDIVMEVVASPAPNFFGSPSWSGYLSNAMNSLENGLGEIGDRTTDPTAYETFEENEAVSVWELIVSSFGSWRGVAGPSAPFDNEFGNRVHFGLHVVGDGTMKFRMADIDFEVTSGDGNSLGFVGDFSASDYSGTRVGIDYGFNMVKGGGDDTIITSGSGTQFVDEFIYVGVGNAYDASGEAGPSDQEKLDQVVASVLPFATFDVTGKYTLNDSLGGFLAEGSTTFQVVPEPASGIALMMLGFVGMLRRRR